MSLARSDQFTGSNNIAKPERLPEGAVVDAVNMDFTVGGKAELRTGFDLIRSEPDIRAIYGAGSSLILIAGSKVIKIDEGADRRITTISQGPVAATWHNSELFLNTEVDSLRIGSTSKPWAIREPNFSVDVISGSLPAGVYKIAVTAVENGAESGCLPMVVTLNGSQSIRVRTYDSRSCRLYSSVANGQTLYHQGSARSINTISLPVDDTARLETGGLHGLPFCSILCSHKSLILGARGNYLYHTRPMLTHLHKPEQDYFQFSAPITIIADTGDGFYVCADKTYYISGIGSAEVAQRSVLEFGAIEGTGVILPDGSVSWFCEYGQVIGGRGGEVQLINRASYSPDTAKDGAAGFLEHNGNQMIVTTMRGESNGSRLASSDHWELEVLNT